MRNILAALALGTSTLLTATPGGAQPSGCAQRDRIIDRLAERYGESRQSIGMGANNSVVEVFASLETGTWTITVTLPDGITCLVASGQSFERLDEAPTPAGVQL